MNHKIFLMGLFVSLIIIGLYSGFENKTGNIVLSSIKENETVTIGYCPTMEKYANSIASQNKNIDLLEFGDASTVMSKLNSKEIDVALIGRKVTGNELIASHEKILKSGFTLVAPSKQFIDYSQLKGMEVYTYLDENTVEYFPELDLKFVKDGEELFKNSNIILIAWEDYRDFMGLFIPLNEDGTKVEKFRTPILYSEDSNLLENIKFIG